MRSSARQNERRNPAVGHVQTSKVFDSATIQQRVTATRWEITSSPMKLRLQMVRRTTHGSQGSQLSCCSQQRVSRTGHRLMAVRLSSVKVFVKGTKFGPAGRYTSHTLFLSICGYKTVINNTNNESHNDDNAVLSSKEHLLGFVTERTFPSYNCPLGWIKLVICHRTIERIVRRRTRDLLMPECREDCGENASFILWDLGAARRGL